MGLIITPVNEYTDAGEFQGILQDIACGCWFTQNGKTIPKLIRAMDERGGMHTIQVLEVLASETKRYSGIETVEHFCRIGVNERQEAFVKLVFTKETCTWKMVFL